MLRVGFSSTINASIAMRVARKLLTISPAMTNMATRLSLSNRLLPKKTQNAKLR